MTSSDPRAGMPRSLHPAISALQFVAQHKATGGASMNVRTGNLLPAGKKAYVVGGEPDKAGKAIPAATYTAGLTVGNVVKEHARVAAASSHPDTMVGSWNDDNGHAVVDASRAYGSKKRAVATGKARGEDAVWDNKNMAEIRTK